MAKASSNQFLASLDGIELSADQAKRISSGIQEVVMRELAKIDTQTDFSLSKQFRIDERIIGKDILINGIRIKAIAKTIPGH